MRISDLSSDVCSSDLLLAAGFHDEDRAGWLRRGFYHPRLDFGVEIVGSRLFDGQTSRTTILPDKDSPEVAFASIEDMIADRLRSEEHTSELQSLMRISYAVFCFKKKTFSPLAHHSTSDTSTRSLSH